MPMFVKILKIVGVTFILLMLPLYLVNIFAIFGEGVKAIGVLFSFALIIYLWIKGYKKIFEKTSLKSSELSKKIK